MGILLVSAVFLSWNIAFPHILIVLSMAGGGGGGGGRGREE